MRSLPPLADGQRYLRPLQVARSLGVSKSLVLVAIRSGDLRAFRLGEKVLLIDPADVEAWLTVALRPVEAKP